jgi:hypothetical protein
MKDKENGNTYSILTQLSEQYLYLLSVFIEGKQNL